MSISTQQGCDVRSRRCRSAAPRGWPSPMTFQHAERLCRALMSADSGDAAVAALRQAGYWDDPKAWRPLGDNPGNLSIVANQQSDPVAALAEKLTNAVDARLINACWTAGVNPEDPDGPNSPRAAVARFIDRKSPEAEKYGGPSSRNSQRT